MLLTKQGDQEGDREDKTRDHSDDEHHNIIDYYAIKIKPWVLLHRKNEGSKGGYNTLKKGYLLHIWGYFLGHFERENWEGTALPLGDTRL